MNKIKLGDVLEVKRGMSLPGEYYATEGDYIRLTLGNFNYPSCGWKKNVLKDNLFFTGNVRDEYILKKGDIITPLTEQVRGLLGNTATIPEDALYIQSGDIGLIIPDETKLDKRFSYYLVSSSVVKKQLDARSQQTKIRHTSPEAIKDCVSFIPIIKEQKKISYLLDCINKKIENNNAINDNLEETAQSLFQEQFAAFYNENELPDGYSIATLDSLCSIKGGKRLPADGELLDTPTAHPYIRVRDLGSNRYVCLTNQFQYIDEETHSAISRYIVNTNDIVISIVGTIGLIGKIHTSLNNANLTENCVKLANIHTVTPDYLYYTLCYKKQIKEIELLTVGAVQSKLPMYNIQSMKILVPPAEVIEDFQHKFDIFNEQIEANTIEIQRLYELQSVLLAKLAY